MRDDIDNLRRIARLIGDEGFVDALTDAERLVNDAEETIDRVEEIERDANRALHEVDSRLKKVDETISLMEAKIEAGFSLLFFSLAFTRFNDGEILLAVALLCLGLLGVSSLLVTVATLPQIRRLRRVGEYASDRVGR